MEINNNNTETLELLNDLGSYVSTDADGNFQIDLDLRATFDGNEWFLELDFDNDNTNEDSVDSDPLAEDLVEELLPELIPEPEPELDSGPIVDLPVDTDTIGFENHESGTAYDITAQNLDWDAEWSNDEMSNFTEVTNEEAYSGNNSLKVTYPSGQQSNKGAGWIIEDSDEYYLQYQIKFEEDFDFNGKYDRSSGGKLPGLGADGLCSGGSGCTGENGFTSRPMWREDGRAVLYLYHMDKKGQYGDDLLLEDSSGNNIYYQPGQWTNITQRVKINDGNQSNGEVDVWINGEQVLDVEGLQFVNNGAQIDRTFFNTFHGGSGSDWWPDQDVTAYFDDFVVSTEAAAVGL